MTYPGNESFKKGIFIVNGIIIFMMPLIVFLKIVEVSSELSVAVGPVEVVGDFFAYYKSKFLQFGSLLSLALTIYYKKRTGWKFSFDRFTVMLMIFASSIILSTAFSDYRSIAFFGYLYRFEGAWSWLSYLVFSYSIYLLLESKEDVMKTILPFVLSSGVVSLIAVVQFSGYDFFATPFGRRLILGPYYGRHADSIGFPFQRGVAYSTLYNPNYIGSMMVLAIPLGLEVVRYTRSLLLRVTVGEVIVLDMVALAVSKSRAGLLGLCTVLILLLLRALFNKKYFAISLIFIVSIIFAGIGINGFAGGYMYEQLSKVKAIFTPIEDGVREITIRGPNMHIEFADGLVINIHHNNDAFWFTDENSQVIMHEKMVEEDFDYFRPVVEKYKEVNVSSFRDTDSVWIKRGSVDIRLYKSESGFKKFPQGGDDIATEPFEVVRLIPNESSFTNRGYIWNRTIPLIKDKLFLGHGSDTFVFSFPQEDVAGRVNLGKVYPVVVDKPHSAPLLVLINFGLFGFLSLTLLIGSSLLHTNDLIFLHAAAIGYLITSMFNDSIIATTFVFFIILAVLQLQFEEQRQMVMTI